MSAQTPSVCTICHAPFAGGQISHRHGPVTLPSGLARTAPSPSKGTAQPAPLWNDGAAGTAAAAQAIHDKITGAK